MSTLRKLRDGEEIEFNSDPDDDQDIQSHIHKGTIIKINWENKQILIQLKQTQETYCYFMDEIKIMFQIPINKIKNPGIAAIGIVLYHELCITINLIYSSQPNTKTKTVVDRRLYSDSKC